MELETQSLARFLNEILILGALRDEAMHGYQIALEIEERSGGYFSFKHGTLYPILHRLEKEGYIDGTWGSGRAPRRRKEYRIGPKGRTYLAEITNGWNELGGRLSNFLAGEEPVPRSAAAGQ